MVFAIAALTVIFSGLIREHSTLIVFGFGSGLGLPAQAVWPLVVFLSFGVAALMAAAQHGPWWLKLLGLVFTLMVMGTWSLRSPSLAGRGGWPILAALLWWRYQRSSSCDGDETSPGGNSRSSGC